MNIVSCVFLAIIANGFTRWQHDTIIQASFSTCRPTTYAKY